MALLRFCNKHDEGAIDISKRWKTSVYHTGQENMTPEELEIVRSIWQKTEGLYVQPYYAERVLSLYELNGYDSDFCATVWDDESQTVKTVTYASTRCWSYPLYRARVDASPEIIEKANVYNKKRHRHDMAVFLWNDRRREIELAKVIKVKNYHQVKRLRQTAGIRFDDLVVLLKTNKFRSAFRAGLDKQVREWLEDKNPRYNNPLSPKQWRYL